MAMHFESTTPGTTKCTIDYLRTNRLMRAPHPAFSPDLAVSDSYVFSKLKKALMGATFTDDGLLQGVMELLNGISREILRRFLRNGF
jgi:hypothetical protein